jgi:hypothetical protein
MSRLFPRPSHAEDQPYAHTILALHVLSRGFAVGAGVASVSYSVRRLVRPSPSLSLLRSSGNGAVIGTGLLALALVGRMWGREEIEWKDRSWRLLWNRGQAEVDEWWAGGAVAGGLGAVVVRKGAAAAGGWRAVVGGMGLGSLLGMMGHAGWRYGVKGGFEEEKVV